MPNYIFGRNDRLYVAKGVSYSTIRNTGGAASLATADACKHKTFTARANRARLAASDKEATAFLGYIDRTRKGRFSGTASIATPLFSSSGAGVEPDYGPVLESAFGKATIAVGASVTYGPALTGTIAKYMDETAPVTCELWGMNAALRGVCAYGALVNRLKLSGGQDSAELTADFITYYTLAQDRFANAETGEKGGLTTWPAEPGTQTYTGSEMTGFTTLLTIDGVAYNPRNWGVDINFNRAYRMDRCAIDGSEYYPSEPYEMMPEVTFTASLWSTDAAAMTTLLGKIANRVTVDASVVVGSLAGGIYTIPLNNLIKPDGDNDPVHSDGDDRKSIDLTLRAQATSTSVRDEVSLILT